MFPTTPLPAVKTEVHMRKGYETKHKGWLLNNPPLDPPPPLHAPSPLLFYTRVHTAIYYNMHHACFMSNQFHAYSAACFRPVCASFCFLILLLLFVQASTVACLRDIIKFVCHVYCIYIYYLIYSMKVFLSFFLQ